MSYNRGVWKRYIHQRVGNIYRLLLVSFCRGHATLETRLLQVTQFEAHRIMPLLPLLNKSTLIRAVQGFLSSKLRGPLSSLLLPLIIDFTRVLDCSNKKKKRLGTITVFTLFISFNSLVWDGIKKNMGTGFLRTFEVHQNISSDSSSPAFIWMYKQYISHITE